jgi:hypothetical protein
MSAPTPAPNPQAISDSLTEIGISGDGAAASAWRAQLRTSTSIAAHLEAIAAAVTAAKHRVAAALRDYTDAAPSAAEIEAAQQELLAASQEDDTGNPDRLKRAEDKLGDLLARRQHAEEKYRKDSSDNVDRLGDERRSADDELSPEAREKLQQLLSWLAAAPAAAMPTGGAPAAPAAACGYPGSGFSPSSDVTADSDARPVSSTPGGNEDPPVQTHTSSDLAPVTSQPTLTNASTTAPSAQSTPVATAAQSGLLTGQSGSESGGFVPPIPSGMGMSGAGRQLSSKSDADTSRSDSDLNRDELLNGDDLLTRSVKGHL